MFTLLYTWPDGQSLGFSKIAPGIWQHIHRHGGYDAQVGPQYPTKAALMIHSAAYQAEVWGIRA